MNTTSSQLPICVHCGTPRPADETLCPECGKPWIDTSIDEAAAGPAVPVVAGAGAGEEPPVDVPDDAVVAPPPPPLAPLEPDDTGEFSFDDWTQPPDEERTRTSWIIALGALAALVVVLAFFLLSNGDTSTTTTVAATETTVSPESTTTTAVTTTSTPPTTTVPEVIPQPDDWPAVGDPIPLDELTLKAAGIGPIDIGDAISDAAGALTASLGEADSSGVDGLCPPEESYWLSFGQLTAIFDGHDSTATFVSYQYDEPGESETELGLMTLSGISLGDTVDDLIETYTQYTISFEVIDSKDHFRLSDGGELLLWGPVSSADPAGLIEGIYSPSTCDTAP